MDRRPSISVIDFRAGEKVRFVPPHAYGDSNHAACQTGTVKGIKPGFVIVDFGKDMELIEPENLVLLKRNK